MKKRVRLAFLVALPAMAVVIGLALILGRRCSMRQALSDKLLPPLEARNQAGSDSHPSKSAAVVPSNLSDWRAPDQQRMKSKATLKGQCKEDVLLFAVKPDTIRRFVPDRFNPVLDEAAMSMALVAVQHASLCRFDGHEVGPSDFIRIWFRVEGPDFQDAIAGADETLPRLCWYSVFEGASNPKARDRQTRAGMATHPIERVSLGLLDSARMSSMSVRMNEGVRWREADPDIPVSVKKIGVDHVIYSQAKDGSFNTHRARGLATARRFFADGIVDVDKGSELATYLDEGTRQLIRCHHFLPIDFEFTYSVSE